MTWPLDCIRQREPLANYTSFRIGGPAEWFAQPSTLEELVQVLQEASRVGLPVSVVGGGTNTLAADRGIGGVVVRLGSGFRTVNVDAHPDRSTVRLRCGAALSTQRLVSLASQYGWGDMEGLAGLPGQLGGAIAMNAQDIGRFVQGLTLVSFDGTVRQLTREQLRFHYRYTALESGIVTEIELQCQKIPAHDAARRIESALAYRNHTQETGLPSAGCAFKNPPGVGAGRLIDQAGLKGCRIGDAQVSYRHANFIVNVGHARCDDVLSLMEYIQRRVDHIFQVTLEPELRVMGQRWSP